MLYGCSLDNKKENFVGEWEITLYEAINPKFPYLNDVDKAIYLSNIYKLTENGEFEIVQKYNTTKGKWKVKNQNVLNFIDSEGNSRNYSIIDLKKNTLQLLDEERFGMTDLFIILKRNK